MTLARSTHSTPLNAWSTVPAPKEEGAKPLSPIDRLFNRFDGMFPHRFKSNFPNKQAVANWKDAWSDSLSRNRISPQQAAFGIAKIEEKGLDWPPALPEFLALCREVIDYERAFHEAANQLHARFNGLEDKWSHPAVYWAAMDFGTFELRNMSYSQASGNWKKCLDKRIESECPPIPPYAPALAAPAQAPDGTFISAAEARKAMAEAARNLVSRRASPESAIERAQKILTDAAASGDTSTPLCRIDWAKQVLRQYGLLKDEQPTPA